MASPPSMPSTPQRTCSQISSPTSRRTTKAGRSDSLSPKSGYSGKMATMMAWNSTSTAAKPRTSSAVPMAIAPGSTPTCTPMPLPSSRQLSETAIPQPRRPIRPKPHPSRQMSKSSSGIQSVSSSSRCRCATKPMPMATCPSMHSIHLLHH